MAPRKGRKAGNSVRTRRKKAGDRPKKHASAKVKARTRKLSRKATPPPVGRRRSRKSLLRRGGEAAVRLVQRLRPGVARSPYDTDLDRNPANYQPLTPLTFLERAASVFPERTAIVH